MTSQKILGFKGYPQGLIRHIFFVKISSQPRAICDKEKHQLGHESLLLNVISLKKS